MKKRAIRFLSRLFFCVIILTSLLSCTKDDAFRGYISGNWEIYKVEQLTWKDGAVINTLTYKDTCGFVLMYQSNPGYIYAFINYPSKFLSTDKEGHWEAWDYETSGKYTITISNRDIIIPADHFRSRKQVWTIPETISNGEQEKIYLKRK